MAGEARGAGCRKRAGGEGGGCGKGLLTRTLRAEEPDTAKGAVGGADFGRGAAAPAPHVTDDPTPPPHDLHSAEVAVRGARFTRRAGRSENISEGLPWPED